MYVSKQYGVSQAVIRNGRRNVGELCNHFNKSHIVIIFAVSPPSSHGTLWYVPSALWPRNHKTTLKGSAEVNCYTCEHEAPQRGFLTFSKKVELKVFISSPSLIHERKSWRTEGILCSSNKYGLSTANYVGNRSNCTHMFTATCKPLYHHINSNVTVLYYNFKKEANPTWKWYVYKVYCAFLCSSPLSQSFVNPFYYSCSCGSPIA